MVPSLAASSSLVFAEEINLNYIFDFVDEHIESVKNHIYYLSSLESRVTGYPGFYKATHYIRQKFIEYNLTEVNHHNWTVVIPIDYGANITVLSPERYTIKAYTLWPNSIQTSPILPPGLTGRLIYVGHGEYEEMNGKPINGSIVLMDFNSGDNWLKAAMLGAKAVIFIEPEKTVTNEGNRKVTLTVPLYFPRLYISQTDAQTLLSLLKDNVVIVNILSNMRLEDKEVSNIYGFIEGTDPILRNETIVISSYYDSFSYIPSLAPGAQEACGISVLLEIARFFSLHPPRRTLMFVAFAGHSQSLLGAKEFMEILKFNSSLYNSVGQKIIINLHLDLNSESPYISLWRLSQQYVGVFLPYSITNKLDAFGDFIFRQKVLPTLQRYEEKPYSFQRNWAEADWHRLLLEWVDEESDVFLMGGSAGYTIFSSNTKRQYHKTPLDTFEKININNLKNPMRFTLATIAFLDAEPDLSLYGDFLKSERIIGTASARYGLSMVRGQVVEYNYTTGWYTPVPNAILHVIRTFPGDPLGSQLLYPVNFFVRADENGYFRIIGETPFSLREANAPGGGTSLPGPYVHAYIVNSSGAILYANDMGKYGAQRYPPLALMDKEEVFLQVVIFRCSSIVLYNCIEPDKVKPAVGLRFVVNDIRSHSEPESYGATLNPYFYNGHVAMIFVPPKTPIEIIMYFSYQEQPLATLINASLSSPTGVGYVLSEGERISLTPYNYAKDFYWLTCYYVDKAASNYISDNFSWRLDVANKYLLEAKNAFIENKYSVFWDYSVKTWLEVWRLYKDVKSALRDTGRAFVLFCFILLPSIILMERLIQFSTGNKRLLFVLTIIAIIFILSYYIHPGLRIVPNPLMTAIGVAILSLTIPLTYIIIGKLFSLLRGYRLETVGRHFAEMKQGQAMWLALNIGCGHAKKRPIRMILNLTLMAIITASLVSLVSFSSEVSVKPTMTFTGKTSYPGILIISEIGSDPIQPQIVEALRIAYGSEAVIAPRAYGWSGSVGTSLAAWKIFWNIEYEDKHDNRSVLTVLGLTPEESMVSGLDKALIDGIWFTEMSDYACIISDQTAQRLGIFNLTQPVHITWEGMNYTVIGIFDSNLVNAILDLDQNRLVPPDIWSSPYQGVSVVRVDSANTMFIPYENALSLGFQVYSVGIAFHEKSYQEIEEKAIEILKRFRRLTYVGKDDYIALYSERSFTSFIGFQYQVVPILIGGLSMMNMLFASVQERSKEIFTLSAVGLSPIQVAFLFLAEALMYAFVGALIGYIIGVAASYFNMVVGLHQGFYINYGSTASFLAIFIIIIFVLVSVIYPMIKASKIVTPSMERKWAPSSKPKGDEWEIALPFTASTIQNALGVVNYLEEYFKSQMHPEAEDFRVVEMGKRMESNRALLKAIVRLRPYEQGVIQEAVIEGKRPAGLNRFVFNIYVRRKQGPRSIWESSNLVFFECIRRQFLYWQSLKEEERTKYMH